MPQDNARVVVLNTGSSSLKFAAYPIALNTAPIVSGSVVGIGDDARLVCGGQERHIGKADQAAALQAVLDLPEGPFAGDVAGFGHRIVHGGWKLDRPVLVDEQTLGEIEAISPLAPLHNPPALAVLKTLRQRLPGIPHVACFDTAFHRGHPAVADRFAIPDAMYQEGVRRYGFHGLSYQYIAGVLPEDIAGGRVIVAHLGSGASMCALLGGRSVDSSMGFTALDGLPMGTRSGSLDAGVILWLQKMKGWSAERIEAFLYHDCGLKGLSGQSSDMRVLLASDHPLARLAVDYFVYHVVQTAGALAASMGGLDGLVFTAGIGEHSAPVRVRILERLAWLGFKLDAAANDAGARRITTSDSGVPAYVIATDEERVIADATRGLLLGGEAH